MEDAVPRQKRSQRSKMRRSLSEKKRRYFYQQFVGDSQEILFERDIEGGKIHGFSGNYIRVAIDYKPEYINQIKKVNLIDVGVNGIMKGELEDSVIAVA